MDVALWAGPIVALLGVGLGGLLSRQLQHRTWQREESQRWKDSRRKTYGEFVAAVRQYRAYITRPTIQISVRSSSDGIRLVPLFDDEGSASIKVVEAAFAEVQLVAEDSETITSAAALFRTSYRMAAARAVDGTDVPGRFMKSLYEAEREFINAARRELGLSNVVGNSFARTPRLNELDRELRQFFESHTDHSKSQSET